MKRGCIILNWLWSRNRLEEKEMKFYECKVEYFDDGAENNTGIWLGYVCAKDYSDAAKKVCDSWEDVILSMSLLETECVDLLDYDACKDFYWKEK